MPLLDVLLCTMGTLIVILGVINREARLHPAKRLPGKAADQQQMVEAHDDLQLRIEQLTTARDKTQADLQNSRTRLSGIEDSSRRLEDQLASLVAAAKQLPEAHTSDDAQRDELRKELAQLNSRRMQLEQDLQKARAEGKYRQPGYAVIPFDGLYKTSRRPIYIECRGDVVILQPEGIEFTRADFLGPDGPNNPLAAALRAAQEYWRNAPRPAPDMPNEAYPLLLVRPDGVNAYWDVRGAMSSWNADFGYEFVGADWKLEYPNAPDPRLIDMENRAVAEARQQLQWLAQISPELFARKANKVQYHVSPNGGGIVRDGGPSFGNDPFADDPLGGFGRTGRNGNSAISGTNGNGGFGGGGGNGGQAGIEGGYPGARGTGGSGMNAGGNGMGPGAYGVGGSDQGGMSNNSTDGSGAGSTSVAGGVSGAGGGPEIADVGPRYAGAGNGTGGFGNGMGGIGNGSQNAGSGSGNGGSADRSGSGNSAMARGAANGTNSNGSATASGGIPGSGNGSPSEYGGVQLPNSAGGMMNASTSHGAGGSGTGSSMGSVGGQSVAGSGQYSTSNGGGGNSPDGGSNSAGEASGNGSSSSITSSGGGSNGATALGSPSGDPNATSGTPTLSVGMPGQSQSAASYDDSQRQQQQQSSASHSMSRNRGKNWALPATRTASIPVQRPIRVECWSDRLVLVPDTRDQQPQIIPLGARTEDAVDPLVNAVRNYTTSWGIAGRGMYWRPQLVLNVNPNADSRAADLQTLLTDSGWDVKRK
jgi:hypothetical protein